MPKVLTRISTTAVILALGAAAAGLIVFLASPETARLPIFALLYFAVFLSAAAAATILGYYFRLVFWRSGVHYEFLKSAQRQGLLFGFFTVISLLLQAGGILSWKTALPLVAVFVLIELYT